MSTPFEQQSPMLQNSSHFQRIANNDSPAIPRPSPVLPPLPRNTMTSSLTNSYMPYSSGYSSFGGYGGGYSGGYGAGYSGGYGTGYGGGYGMPYRSYGMYNSMGAYPSHLQDDTERRFIQYAEESSRSTFANVENIVKAVNSISMMLDNTFFAMTSSFRAVLSVAENFGRLRNMFGHIWQTISLFRLFNWLYRRFMALLGYKVPKSAASVAWKQAAGNGAAVPPSGGSSWPTFAFLGVLISAPYIISKFLPKYEDASDPANWKTAGCQAKAAFDFAARTPNELSFQKNDEVILAPMAVQEKMGVKNSGWAFAVCNGKAGTVPLNYLVINKAKPLEGPQMPVPRIFNENGNGTSHKSALKRVSFGENQIFENVDLEDYISGKKNVGKIAESTSQKEATAKEVSSPKERTAPAEESCKRDETTKEESCKKDETAKEDGVKN